MSGFTAKNNYPLEEVEATQAARRAFVERYVRFRHRRYPNETELKEMFAAVWEAAWDASKEYFGIEDSGSSRTQNDPTY